MRNLHRALVSSFVATLLVASLSPACAQPTNRRLAPADEYFGPLKMSVLGIRNTLRDESLRLAVTKPLEPAAAYAHAALVERSVQDWEVKYPRDSWLPRAVFALQHLFAQIPTAQSHNHAAEVAGWLIARYPRTAEAEQMRLELAQASGAAQR
jgi:hypothetical protein